MGRAMEETKGFGVLVTEEILQHFCFCVAVFLGCHVGTRPCLVQCCFSLWRPCVVQYFGLAPHGSMLFNVVSLCGALAWLNVVQCRALLVQFSFFSSALNFEL